MIGGKRPTARQQRWRDWLGKQPCCATGNACEQLHHAVGSTAKHNKIWIGEDWLIPLTAEAHRAIDSLGRNRKTYEKMWFSDLIERAHAEGVKDVPPDEVIEAIMDYHR